MTTPQKEGMAQRMSGVQADSEAVFPAWAWSMRSVEAEGRAQGIWRPTGSKKREVRSGCRAWRWGPIALFLSPH